MKHFFLYSIVMVLCLQSCRKDLEPVPPLVYTESVSNITSSSACFYGRANGIGAFPEVVEKGFCLSKDKKFTKEESFAITTTQDSYSGSSSGLLPNCTYYVRAYAENLVGRTYGEIIAFKTLKTPPQSPAIVTITNVTDTTAVLTIEWVTLGNNGFCYGYYGDTSSNSSSIYVGDNVGTYSTTLTNLQPNTTYFVRAYTSNTQISYSDVSLFTTLPRNAFQSIQDGCIMFPFSVSDSSQVYFSQGNLQYQSNQPSPGLWRFAEHQYDYIGFDNNNISSTYNGWIDLFAWGTSGSYYKPFETHFYNIYWNADITDSQYDWGIYNAISNGGNKAGIWRTLTSNEWDYLLDNRVNATEKFGYAQISDKNGPILLPDVWSLPKGLSFLPNNSDYADNIYNKEQWEQMESAGAVFLPAAGYRDETKVEKYWYNGYYWSSSNAYTDGKHSKAFEFSVESNFMGVFKELNEFGLSVRLVRDVTKK